MKILFAVSNENITSSIVKKYQQKYKEIITSKNVYYFNAIIKELQKDKSYDRIIISEDLEPFANNNYDTIDKFIFDKLDSITDEATNISGSDIPIILICSDRRGKSDGLLVKIFGIGIYDALLGSDRSIDSVCNLINKPRSKKEAKVYYRIDVDDVDYKPENESDVSELEIQNILIHYRKLGKNEDKFVESFHSIMEQYNDAQLKVIAKFLPLNVKAVLEAKSSAYQELMTYGRISHAIPSTTSNMSQNTSSNTSYNSKAANNLNKEPELDFVNKSLRESRISGPVIIPKSVSMSDVKSYEEPKYPPMGQSAVQRVEEQQPEPIKPVSEPVLQQPVTEQPPIQPVVPTTAVMPGLEPEPIVESSIVEESKRGRGRPKKVSLNPENANMQRVSEPKRGRGRPRKANPSQDIMQELNAMQPAPGNPNQGVADSVNLFELDEQTSALQQVPDTNTAAVLPGMDEMFETNNTQAPISTPEPVQTQMSHHNLVSADDIEIYNKPNQYKTQYERALERQSKASGVVPNQPVRNNVIDQNQDFDHLQQNNQDYYNAQRPVAPAPQPAIQQQEHMGPNRPELMDRPVMQRNAFTEQRQVEQVMPQSNYADVTSNLMSSDKKIVAFVGTSKNGTSFLVNNLAELLSRKGIQAAILDLTQNRNSYYIYTENEEELRKKAFECNAKLLNGIADGIKVNKNLSVFTSLPGENIELDNVSSVMNTLTNSHSVILLDCDFHTNKEYFMAAQELYLVQSLDVLTIQPLTEFLRDLKSKNILDQSKLRIVINKNMHLKGVTEKTIIGGMSSYNEPAMSFMSELFDKDHVKYVDIPFEEQIYLKYLEGLINCEITLNGYSKTFLDKLEILANMVYPLISGSSTISGGGGRESKNYNDYDKHNKRKTFSNNMDSTLDKMKAKF